MVDGRKSESRSQCHFDGVADFTVEDRDDKPIFFLVRRRLEAAVENELNSARFAHATSNTANTTSSYTNQVAFLGRTRIPYPII